MSCATEDTDVDVLRCDVAVDHAGNDDGWDCETPCYLADYTACTAEGGTEDFFAGVGVADCCDDQVHSCICDLQGDQGLGEVLGFFHFGDETEKGDVTGVGEDNVGDA